MKVATIHTKTWIGLLALLIQPGITAVAETYYIDADGGSDGNAGTSPAAAWATLARASAPAYQPGDRILLQAGDTFAGKLLLQGRSGSAGAPIVIAAYGEGPPPVINASGYLAGVHIRNCRYIEVRDLEITADGGAMVDGSPEGYRYGVYVDCTSGNSINHITIDNLYLHDIYPNAGTPSEGAMPTTHMGTGVGINGVDRTLSSNITVRNCRIERMGFKAIEPKQVSFMEILDNRMQDIGGPAIQPGRVSDLVVRGNVVDGSGSFIDPRMHGRGSGIWPWSSERVLIEKNTFMHARGRADSCGIHIDFNCRDVVVQYNLSVDNAGGFIEILGNNYNCTYRYNISVNDGARVKGVIDQGTIPNNQDGHILWTSGYVGGGTPQGPTNSYIYNNTIYVKPGQESSFSIQDTTRGLLVANNIFYVEGATKDVTATGSDNYTQDMVDHVVWKNNLYQRVGIVPVFYNDSPSDPSFTETEPQYGDPLFADTGGLLSGDYIPQSVPLIIDKGITIEKLPDDAIGLLAGLAVTEDFFGNPIIGLPDMGAVELGGAPLPLPDAAFTRDPAFVNTNAASMEAITGPPETEYYFAEVSGNYGGDDSGWQSDPVYVDDGLLPNTTYAYTVTLRDVLGHPGAPSAVRSLTTPARSPYVDPSILFEDFSTGLGPANSAAPFPAETWFVAYEPEDQTGSVTITSGKLRTGWGYDRTITLWFASRYWNSSYGCRFSGDWEIASALDLHQGIIVGLGEFDPLTGELLRRVKEATIGDLEAPAAGQTGSFAIEVSAAELAAGGISGFSFIGVFIEHPGSPTPARNDVYLVDNLQLVLLGAEADSDGDGIPDSAEPGLGLDPGNPADGAADRDGDHWSNFQEFLTGTDLNNPQDNFRVALFGTGSGGLGILLPGANDLPGRLYILERSQDFGAWTAVDAFSGTLSAPAPDRILPLALPGTSSFWRLRVEWE